MIVAGEHSGDLLGADLIAELKLRGFGAFFGTGGDEMQRQGAELITHVREMNVVGFVEALRAYRRLKLLAQRLRREAQARKAGMAILIDYPGFNLRLADMLRSDRLFVVCLVSPQLWAWNYGRIAAIRRSVDLMLPLFPFEEQIYREEGVPAAAIGHPLVQRIPRRLRREPPLALQSARRPVIALLPGSRRSEVSRLVIPMLDAARILKRAYPRLRLLLAGVEQRLDPLLRSALQRYPDLEVDYSIGQSLRILESCDATIIASGTATLEAAYLGKPMVLLYRVGWLNLFLISAVIRTRFIGIVNILARRPTVLELLQTEATGENAAREICRILEDRSYREAMLQELAYVRKQMGRGNPAAHASDLILDRIRQLTGR
ncbi:MAG: lipid-A-disaccharide synthase [Leptospirales bacterium]|nr:lipid-A-disaccharide synthase [Leptospirales bacterium]